MNVTRLKLPAIRRAVQQVPWAIQLEKLEAMLEVLEVHAAGGGFAADDIRARIAAKERASLTRVQGAIAVLPLYGVVSQRMNMMTEFSGGTSTELFGRDFEAAVNNPEVGAIVLDVDSPGGSVAGTPELAKKIFDARGKKPIVAVVNALMASAAYWIASAADEIWAIPSADGVGAIGCYMVHEEISELAAKEGVKFTIIRAPENKGEGTPYEPLSADALEHLKGQVREIADMFEKAVAKHRGMGIAEVRSKFGRGRSFLPSQALSVGMIDKIGTLDEVIAKLGGGKAVVQRPRAESTEPAMAAAVPVQIVGSTIDLSNPRVREAVNAAIAAHAPKKPSTREAVEDTDFLASHTQHTQPAPIGQETPVQTPTAAPPGAGTELTVESILASERKRASDIRALCRQEGVTDAFADELVNSGVSIGDASSRLLKERKNHLAKQPHISVGDDLGAAKPFASLGEQLQAICMAGLGKADAETLGRLHFQAAASGAAAGVGSDGGFLVQKDFSTELLESAFSTDEVLKDCDTHEVGPNADGLEVAYLDETSRATGSRWGGVQVYRGAEADEPTAKKPKLGKWECRLEDIIGAAYLTERLLQDAPSIQSVFEAGFTAELQFIAVNEIIRGSGAGEMLGILNAGCTVSIAEETGQLDDTIVAENVQKMWRSVPPRSRARGKWYYNTECEQQLQNMMIGTGASGQLVYMPPGGLSGSQYGTIYGRPCIPIEQASGLGDVGDFFFADFSQFKVITKGGVQSAESIHVKFLSNQRTLRWLLRINGAPKPKAAITPFKRTDSNYKLSPFVTLAAR